MKVFVTGANGFLGSSLVKHLINAGYSVRAMVRKKEEARALKGKNIDFITGNVTDSQTVDKAVVGCDVILHLAFLYTFYPWWEKEAKGMYKINVEGTRNLLTAAFKHKIKKFIFTSSIATIGSRPDGRPSNEDAVFNLWPNASHYAKSKLMAEYEVFKFSAQGLPVLILNPAIIIGEGDYKPTPSGEIIVKFLNRRYPAYFDAMLAIADVDDVAKAHISAITKGVVGQRYILCHQTHYSMKDLFKLLEEISGVKAPIIKVPYWLLLAFIYFEEACSYFILKKKPLMPSEGVKFCKMSIALDNSLAVKELGYAATPIRETLTKAVNWYKANGYVKAVY